MSSPWTEEGYSDLVAATLDGSEAVFSFANGQTVSVPRHVLGVPAGAALRIDPDEPTGVFIEESGRDPRRLPWETIRSAGDAEFARHRRDVEREEARRIGRRLKALREDLGLPQKQVAEMVDMKPPQLAKIEQGETDLRVSTVRALLTAMGTDWHELAGRDVPEVSRKSILRRVKDVGVDRSAAERILDAVGRRSGARAVARAFGIDFAALSAGHDIAPRRVSVVVNFKSAGAGDPRRNPMLVAAEQISAVVARAVDSPARTPDPTSLVGCIDLASAPAALKALTEWSWDNGIPVIPLYGKGGFSAAIWEMEKTPIVLLKDTRALAVFWLFDLAHELGHLARGHVGEGGVVDVEDPAFGDSEDEQEREATAFALDLILPRHGELIEEIRTRALPDGRHLFKPTVADVAKRERLDPALLGIVAAFALTDVARPRDRWGSAQKLASGPPGRDVVRQVLRQRLSFSAPDPLDEAWMRALLEGG